MQFLKRQLPVALAFLAGTLLWAQFYVPSRLSQHGLEVFTATWSIVIFGAALILGVMSAVHYHVTKVKLKKPGFGYSIITLTAFTITALAGLLPVTLPGFSAGATHDGGFWKWIFNYVFVPLDATTFSLLAFFIASAAFRAFRARSPEATALLIAGCIVMLGRVPLGDMIPVWPHAGAEPWHISELSQWIMDYMNAAGQRGILLGILLSVIGISLRVIFGIERTYMGGAD
jgi:predicted membrane channel-forming protein YqfA (hemolysin III family)